MSKLSDQRNKDKLSAISEERSAIYRECFGTIAGKRVLSFLMDYYKQPIDPTTALDMAFKCGQRDVARLIIDSVMGGTDEETDSIN